MAGSQPGMTAAQARALAADVGVVAGRLPGPDELGVDHIEDGTPSASGAAARGRNR